MTDAMSAADTPTPADTLVLPGVALPPSHRLVSLATRPDLQRALSLHCSQVWAPFMLEDAVSNELWHHLAEDFPAFQLLILDGQDRIMVGGNAAPLVWDGTDEGLPDGWDDQLQRSVTDMLAGRKATSLGAIQVVVDPIHQGNGWSGVMLRAMCSAARAHGLRALMACVRPTWKERYPLVPIERYVTWRRGDGLPFDPWVRLHVRSGGRIVRSSPRSMQVTGSVAQWQEWAGMPFPESGDFVVPGAAALVHIDRDVDLGTYHDPNVWIVHDLT